jgi:hypothetical protein
MQSSRLKPQARPHALADLEATIAEAERLKEWRLRTFERLNPSLKSADRRRAEGLLRMAEQRLAHLRRSREVLLRGEQPGDAEEEAEVS